MQRFEGTKHVLPQALAAWEGRAALSDEASAASKRHAEEALAADRVARTRLGYEVLVKLKGDELLERESRRMDVEDHRERSRALLRTPELARLQ